MKKIIAITLVLAMCLIAMTSCGGNKDVDAVMEMFEASKPTKIVATTTHAFARVVLNGEFVLTTGTVGGVDAAVYEEKYQELRSVEEGGAVDIVVPAIKDVHTITQYIEGKGQRSVNPESGNKGKWNAEAGSLVPERGAIAINLKGKLVEDAQYSNNTLTFVIPAKNTGEVLGESNAVNADIYGEVVDNGAEIIGVKLTYVIPADESKFTSETTVTINIVYTYDAERIYID